MAKHIMQEGSVVVYGNRSLWRALAFEHGEYIPALLMTPLLTLSLEATHGEVGIAPHPDDLKQKILDLINDVTKVTSAIMSIEYELVPFCNLPQHLMFDLQTDPHREEGEKKEEARLVAPTSIPSGPVDEGQLLRAAKAATAEVIEECLFGPREVQAEYQKYAYLFQEEVGADLDPLDVETVRVRTDAYLQAGTEIEKLTTEIVKCADQFSSNKTSVS
ncbi:unnamed protein product [Durusdinium trenchii]|uniref:Uncharacterized protein n=1 Tax=Durusdinium trenchii TaxID=1381693 RepID=A0ABP0N9W2_9DINO